MVYPVFRKYLTVYQTIRLRQPARSNGYTKLARESASWAKKPPISAYTSWLIQPTNRREVLRQGVANSYDQPGKPQVSENVHIRRRRTWCHNQNLVSIKRPARTQTDRTKQIQQAWKHIFYLN